MNNNILGYYMEQTAFDVQQI